MIQLIKKIHFPSITCTKDEKIKLDIQVDDYIERDITEDVCHVCYKSIFINIVAKNGDLQYISYECGCGETVQVGSKDVPIYSDLKYSEYAQYKS